MANIAPTSSSAGQPLSLALNVRLSLMMFLQYAIWGAWLPLLWPFLREYRHFTPAQIGDMFAIGALGMIVAPFIAGQFADRYFSTERFLAVSHIVGGLLILQLADLSTYRQFLIFSLLYSLLYSPTLPLTNALAFRHLPDRDRDFGKVRVWGTIGWIVVGIGIGQWLLYAHTPDQGTSSEILASQIRGMADAFRLSAYLGIAMGVYCLTLPHTPPAKGKQKNATLEALTEIKRNPLITLFILAVPISCIYQFYFVHTSQFLGLFQSKAATEINRVFGVGGGGLMTIGQMSEMVILALMPFAAKRFSRKTLLATGVFAAALRMGLFAYVDQIQAHTGIPAVATLVTGIAMHGICFGCFTFVAFMIVDEETTSDVRASAQSLFFLVSGGVGTIAGSVIASSVATWATSPDGPMDYTKLFSVPMWAAFICFVALLLFYPSGKQSSPNLASRDS